MGKRLIKSGKTSSLVGCSAVINNAIRLNTFWSSWKWNDRIISVLYACYNGIGTSKPIMIAFKRINVFVRKLQKGGVHTFRQMTNS
jgi:hypothetical protein